MSGPADNLMPKAENTGSRAERRMLSRHARLGAKPRQAGYGRLKPYELPYHWHRRVIKSMSRVQPTLAERNELERTKIKAPDGKTLTQITYQTRDGKLRKTWAPGGIARFIREQVVNGKFDRFLEHEPKVNKPRRNRAERHARKATRDVNAKVQAIINARPARSIT